MTFSAPPRIYTALESRAGFEYVQWSLSRRLLGALPKGDGHPVLVLPGFTAADSSTVQLRALLRQLGYRTYGWKLGNNVGPTPLVVKGLDQRLRSISERAGGAPVSVIGWSLGGIYARDLARRHPDLVRQVITLGSPFRMEPGDPSAARRLWQSVAPLHDPNAMQRMAMVDHDELLPVPSTSIYTRTDGIVHWRTCLEQKSPTSQNVEVYGSHCGLGFNTSVALVVADRLAQDLGKWKRFRPPVWALAAFPRPSRWRPATRAAKAA